MKRFLAFILLLVYFTSATGAVISTHYCGGKISSVTVKNTNKEKCKICKAKEEKKKGCCKTEHKILKVDDTHKSVDLSYKFTVSDYINTPSYYFQNEVSTVNDIKVLRAANTSPPLRKVPVYLYNCVFRI